jgi:hypothetical protein
MEHSRHVVGAIIWTASHMVYWQLWHPRHRGPDLAPVLSRGEGAASRPRHWFLFSKKLKSKDSRKNVEHVSAINDMCVARAPGRIKRL